MIKLTIEAVRVPAILCLLVRCTRFLQGRKWLWTHVPHRRRLFMQTPAVPFLEAVSCGQAESRSTRSRLLLMERARLRSRV